MNIVLPKKPYMSLAFQVFRQPMGVEIYLNRKWAVKSE